MGRRGRYLRSKASVTISVPNAGDLTDSVRTRAVAPTSQRRGVLISRAYEGGPEIQHDVVQCIHCQRAFVYVKGSGVKRGWCMNCNGITCGPDCFAGEDVCLPARQMLDNMRDGRPLTYRPICAPVPRTVRG